ncbi:hypothetical protein EDB19DRAFT_1781290 [Suillus lakei]|nr:hypothetical protein EDB19DRAFT_1781290 [Suillus lakei]
MPKEDIDLPDWSKLSGTALSSAPHALTEVKQMRSYPRPIVNLPDWSKLSGAVLSRASDALTEIKQLRNQAMSRKDINMPNIDWSKVSGDLSRASDALTEAKQLVNQISMYRHWSSDMPMFQQYQEKVRRLIEMNCDLFGVHWTKVWRNILPGAYQLRDTILSDASKLWSIILSRAFRLWGVILCGPSKLWGAMLWGSSKLLGAVTLDTYKLWDTTRILLSTSGFQFHPYVTAGVLLCISENPRILLTPLQLMGKPCTNVDAHKLESTVVLSVSWLTGLGGCVCFG